MELSKQVRLLDNKWNAGTGWPKRLESLTIKGVRGWTGQRLDFPFPIVAICGENGSGKSTILQAAASVYKQPQGRRTHLPGLMFPDTCWDQIRDAEISFTYRQGPTSTTRSLRKLTDRWRGHPDRPERQVEYVDLSRILPVAARVGYSRLAHSSVHEGSAESFAAPVLGRLSEIMGRRYSGAKMAVTTIDLNRAVPVLTTTDSTMSGFHQGAGETMVTELLAIKPAKYSLILIDEIESSLHPSSQRRLMRDLADWSRELEVQFIITTHSPYVLAELPPIARGYILQATGTKRIIFGVSPEFALTKMDEEPHPECDLYVEDDRAEQMLREILVRSAGEEVERCRFIQYGAASVGRALGEMVGQFPQKSIVFVDGDQPQMPGCILLPGHDAPERVVFGALRARNWSGLESRTGRQLSPIIDACERAMTTANPHEWVGLAATRLLLGGDVLWTLMCQEWASCCLDDAEATRIGEALRETLALGSAVAPARSMTPDVSSTAPAQPSAPPVTAPRKTGAPPEQGHLFAPQDDPK